MHAHPWSNFERRHGRLFERGDLKYVILELLDEHPAHGYEVIRALEERFGGVYTPSAGAVYPTLQMLEDMEYVTSTQQDGKRIYSITEAGRGFLVEQKETVDNIRKRTGSWWSNPRLRSELHDMRQELRDFAHTLRQQKESLTNPETVRQIRDVVGRARKEIEAILRGRGDGEEEKRSSETSDKL